MIPGLGKQSITIGSAPTCDVVLAGPGVLPEHARIVHQGGGKLIFIGGAGPASAGGRQLVPGEQVPFDFRTQFFVAQTPVPLSSPAIVLMLAAPGALATAPGQVVVGRDPARASLVLQHPSVSSQHATITLDRMMVIDHNSTSGTYVGTQRIQPGAPTPLDPQGLVSFGPVPLQVGVLMQIAQASRATGAPGAAAMPGTNAMSAVAPQPAAQAPVAAMSQAQQSPGTAIASAVSAPPAAGRRGARTRPSWASSTSRRAAARSSASAAPRTTTSSSLTRRSAATTPCSTR